MGCVLFLFLDKASMVKIKTVKKTEYRRASYSIWIYDCELIKRNTAIATNTPSQIMNLILFITVTK